MNNTTFGRRIATLRKAKGLTQSQLADILNITNKAISRWETGEGFPEITLLKPLSEVLGVTVDQLLQDEEEYNSRNDDINDIPKVKNEFQWGQSFKNKEKSIERPVNLNSLKTGKLRDIIVFLILIMFFSLIIIIGSLLDIGHNDIPEISLYATNHILFFNIFTGFVVLLSITCLIIYKLAFKQKNQIYAFLNYGFYWFVSASILVLLCSFTFNSPRYGVYSVTVPKNFLEYGLCQSLLAVTITLVLIYGGFVLHTIIKRRNKLYNIVGARNFLILLSLFVTSLLCAKPVRKFHENGYTHITEGVSRVGKYFEFNLKIVTMVLLLCSILFITIEILIYIKYFKKNGIKYNFNEYSNGFWNSLTICNKISFSTNGINLILNNVLIVASLNHFFPSANNTCFFQITPLVMIISTMLFAIAFWSSIVGIVLGALNKADKQLKMSLYMIAVPIIFTIIFPILNIILYGVYDNILRCSLIIHN